MLRKHTETKVHLSCRGVVIPRSAHSREAWEPWTVADEGLYLTRVGVHAKNNWYVCSDAIKCSLMKTKEGGGAAVGGYTRDCRLQKSNEVVLVHKNKNEVLAE